MVCPSAEQIIQLLQLQKHPTCGFVAETYRSAHQLPVGTLPPGYRETRALGSVLYFLVTPDAQIALHRIRADQMYHYYGGDPLEVLLLYPDGHGAVSTVGFDPQKGIRPQLFIPGGTYHVSRLALGGQYALLGTSEWPAVEPEDVELGQVEHLIESYPTMREAILSFTTHRA